MEPGEREPRLVPQEDQVGLDRQAFLHHALTSYTMPSNVQLVSNSILTRSSLPARLSASSFDLISRSGTAPYIEYR